ncbi:MAG: MBL fold metallo-hydrolase [Anaerocolumna aminovalerica]|uniref:MBL fold metallo-hydrolase n=1 Tax=Anaerocolumna aminovalerica TaxID=1527 RepID=UPI00290CD371|nr:MBL fold metallo-hydrolase [Anaerocolumna aminovalerica]MDU6263768.1 MBL fold metallo-hydrolase [Anaerocolumna aminovalerica]
MKFRCLGSGSSGNCYLLEGERECLVIEAGLPFKIVKQAIDFEVGKIMGVLVSHEHGDHAKYVKEYQKAGIFVAMSNGTAETIGSDDYIIRPGYWYQYGGFNITPFKVVHDAAEPFGFIIRHEKIGTMLFVTDTEYIKPNFKALKLNHVMVECNYSQKIIDSRVSQGDTDKGLRDRVLQSHMELETCKSFIEANKTASLYNVCLLHLSDGNSNESKFKEEIKQIVGAGTEVFVADKGLEIVLDLCPF